MSRVREEHEVFGKMIVCQKLDGQEYFNIEFDNGEIQIKFDDDGVVVDILDSKKNESVVSTWATYEDMIIDEDELPEDLADDDLFQCMRCGHLSDIENSVEVHGDLYCDECSHKEELKWEKH